MTDTFSGSNIQSIIKPLRPKGEDWREIPVSQEFSLGHPLKAFQHKSGLSVLSAVEVVLDEDKGPEYHISISKSGSRCTANEAKWALEQFELDGFEEDNHVPSGKVRNFWRPVNNNLVGLECPCKEEEPEIVEDKGDFIWRPDSNA